MSPLVKYALPLAFVLPLGGFVAGSLLSAAQDDPDPRTPIVLREDSSETPATGTPRDKPSDPGRPPTADSDVDDEGNDDVDGDDHVVRPEPVDDDEDDGDDAGEDEGDDTDEDGDDGDDGSG